MAVAIRAGASVAPLAAATNTPEDQRNNRDVQVDRLPAPYAELASVEAGQVAGPFEVPSAGGTAAFAVVKVTERQAAGEFQLSDVEEQVRERLQEQMMTEQIVNELRRTTHVAVTL